jgi:hypothetical protein
MKCTIKNCERISLRHFFPTFSVKSLQYKERERERERKREREREVERESEDQKSYLYYSCKNDIQLISYMT